MRWLDRVDIRLNAMAQFSRRGFLAAGPFAAMAVTGGRLWGRAPSHAEVSEVAPLAEFGYAAVSLASELHEAQLRETHAVLMALSEDSLLKPLRQLSGMPAPGQDLGDWYSYDPAYNYRKNFDVGFAPACPFGQWVSALARAYAITGDEATRAKVMRLNRLYAQTITADFYVKNRFPAYCYDKLLLGLIDSHTYVKDPLALSILEQTTNTALPHCLGMR